MERDLEQFVRQAAISAALLLVMGVVAKSIGLTYSPIVAVCCACVLFGVCIASRAALHLLRLRSRS